MSTLREYALVPGQPTSPASSRLQPVAGVGQSAGAHAPSIHLRSPIRYALGSSAIPLPGWKRALDLAGCVVALPLLALSTAIMLVLTRRHSPGPVFYRQERIGYMGRRFHAYKFRTHRLAGDTARGSRLIPQTSLFRALGLEDLPQIVNVLRGEMSLVGPRPCAVAELGRYKAWQRRRCDTLPGLTGLCQISAKTRTSFDHMIRLDLQYIRECSFGLDLEILGAALKSRLRQLREAWSEREASPDDGCSHPERPPATAPAPWIDWPAGSWRA